MRPREANKYIGENQPKQAPEQKEDARGAFSWLPNLNLLGKKR